LHNGVNKQKLQNIYHKTLCKAGLSYEVVKAGLCGASSQRHNLNNTYIVQFFFCHLVAIGEVELTWKLSWSLSGISCALQEIVINYANCVKLQLRILLLVLYEVRNVCLFLQLLKVK
jgi:hypothetical protein